MRKALLKIFEPVLRSIRIGQRNINRPIARDDWIILNIAFSSKNNRSFELKKGYVLLEMIKFRRVHPGDY